MKSKPYIGVTGATSIAESLFLTEVFKQNNYTLKTPHIPMLGFLASHKTLNKIEVSNRRYPQIEKIPKLLETTDRKVFTTIHYNTREKETLSDQISELFSGIYQNGLCQGLQTNIVWPESQQLQRIKGKFPDMKIILQLSHTAMKDRSPEEIADQVANYSDTISYTLVDPSGGRGLPFNIEDSVEIYKAIQERNPNLRIGVAGGFTARNTIQRNIDLTHHLQTANYSIDAEGGLRDKITDKYGDDTFNYGKSLAYIKNTKQVLP
ncbi:MAG: hypothetical protein ACI83O_000507 [Patescibacteria group bacterium]|jgi:hypothetical protein